MKAIVCSKPGPPEVLQLRELEKPTPKDNEVLVEIHAATVTRGDVLLRSANPLLRLLMRMYGVRSKRIPGHELAGVIASVGKDVKRFEKGEDVLELLPG